MGSEAPLATIAALTTAAVAVIGALAAAVVRILKAIKEMRTLVVAGQDVGAARGMIRDQKQREIHVLVNNRLMIVLRLLVLVTKREADRTHAAADVEAARQAKLELDRLEASTDAAGAFMDESQEQLRIALDAEAHLAHVRAALGEPPPPAPILPSAH